MFPAQLRQRRDRLSDAPYLRLGFRPVGQKILEDHVPLSPLERGTAFSARYLAIKCLRISFGPNELIFCAALRTCEGGRHAV
jgi:hypothetical protein